MVRKIIRKALISPLVNIINDGRSVGIILFCCTIFSLFFANSSLWPGYGSNIVREIHYPSWLHLPHTPLHWINDGLMALFFFLVGMEIKRELLTGELRSIRKAMLPIGGAIGGMLLPAGIFLLINVGRVGEHGWGIPMATDIAFSLGIASLLGKRVPMSLKIFLTALAIIDDLGAIIVIAIFYGGQFSLVYFFLAVAVLALTFLLNRIKPVFGIVHIVLGILLWYFVFNSGIHATIAGVLFALMVPLNRLEKIEHALHTPVNFIILPIFALANTVIHFPSDLGAAIQTPLSWGIVLGLLLGKPLGICLACFILVKMKWGELPRSSTWMQMLGIGLLAGIGFTMSIFIAMLAFGNPQMQDTSKIGVLLGSLASVILGYLCLLLFSKKLTPAV